MPWYVGAFGRAGDEELRYSYLVAVDKSFVRSLWSFDEDDPVIGAAFPVTLAQVADLQPLLPAEIDLATYQYELWHERDGE